MYFDGDRRVLCKEKGHIHLLIVLEGVADQETRTGIDEQKQDDDLVVPQETTDNRKTLPM